MSLTQMRERLGAYRARVSRIPLVAFFLGIVRTFRFAQCHVHAGELAFYTILSFIPFCALVMSALAIASTLWIGPQWTPEQVMGIFEKVLPSLIPESSDIHTGEWSGMVRDRTSLGVIGLAAIYISANMMMQGVNRALAAIFEIERRSLFKSLFYSGVVIFFLAIFIIAGISVMSMLGADSLQDTMHLGPVAWPVPVRLGLDAVLLLAYASMFKMFVRIELPLGRILIGGVAFCVMYEVARLIYTLYLSNVTTLSLIYGGMAGAMAVLLWCYYVSLVFLFSACLVRVLTRPPEEVME
jgi:membrane protein